MHFKREPHTPPPPGRWNLQQRVFDACYPFPQTITIHSIRAALPSVEAISVKEAVHRLCKMGKLEAIGEGLTRVYRRRKGARRPVEMRGQHGKVGRRRRPRVAR